MLEAAFYWHGRTSNSGEYSTNLRHNFRSHTHHGDSLHRVDLEVAPNRYTADTPRRTRAINAREHPWPQPTHASCTVGQQHLAKKRTASSHRLVDTRAGAPAGAYKFTKRDIQNY